MQDMEIVGRHDSPTHKLVLHRQNGKREEFEFSTHAEAFDRASIIEEAFTWIGTPFRNCGDIKGRTGAVDCAMLLVRCYVDTGVLPPFDPRPYPPQWHFHHSEERFLKWVMDDLRGVEVQEPKPGDILVYQFGRCFSHGGIVINKDELIHAFYRSEMVEVASRVQAGELTQDKKGHPRPVRFFQVGKWS